ncbi:Na+/H+ antiporter NhaC [Microbulbifer magnicolonia]|uniref:Na+/H+ antiporter NhaC n=1 Tax=Microbulbifer magnicolonia TaxID=3109744 RepID=UPI002B40B7C3|nr:Na+/H+ antiporter NhaC [Microbulbifer sp. GG15]
MNKPESQIPLWLALTPPLVLIGLLALSVYLFGDSSSSGPNQLALMLAAAAAALVGLYRGQSWAELEKAMIKGIGLSMNACLILLMVGTMIGSWIVSGTAPALIYYGLGLLDPQWLYPVALVICAMVSVSIGSAWTTAGTIGIALLGVAHVMGLSLPITAGAVVSGAYFGDKMSPLSDTTNLAPAMAGSELFTHIRHMLWTTVPSFVIALLLFCWLAAGTESSDTADAIAQSRELLASQFNVGWPTFIPLLVVLGLALRKMPAYPAILLGGLTGALVALLYQPEALNRFAAAAEPGWRATLTAIWQAMTTGYVSNTGDEVLDSLLSRGGMASMLNTVWLIVAAMSFGAVMEHTGLLQRLVQVLLKQVRGTGSLIATTAVTAFGMNIIGSDQYMAIVLPGRMFRLEFKRRGLAPENLSRTLEDAGTMTSALVPWNTCGAFMAGTLGVATLAYAPYAFLNLINPLMAIIYGFANFKIVRIDDKALTENDDAEVEPLAQLEVKNA